MANEESICHRTFAAMVDDVEALSLVKECRELEERYKSSFTSQILNVKDSADGLIVIREAQEYIIKEDQTLLLNKVSNYQFLHHIAVSVGWKKLWDHALDHGSSVIKGMKNLVRVITYPDHATSKCPLCDMSELDQITLAEHFTDEHTKSDSPWTTLIDSLTTMDPSCYSHVLCFLNTF